MARVVGDGNAEIYLVVNNRNEGGVVALQVEVVGAASTEVLDARDQPIVAAVPSHSELYMMPGGVRILATAIVQSSAVPVRIRFDGGEPFVIDARVIADGAPVPDHHDYVHD